MTNPFTLNQGQKVGAGRFTLVKELGRGGMGVVWLAQDTQLNEQVALKFLPPEVAADPAALNDLRRETVRSHRLTHPNIIRIHDFHQQPDGVAFISMEYVDGPTLTVWRLQQPKQVLVWAQLAPLVQQLCAALDYAHGEKVIHRDLKPANMMLDNRGRLKLADFGIAAVVSDSVSRVSAHKTSGTLAYMSPQQLEGCQPTVSDDIYALGATLYELLTGRPPFYSGDITHQVLRVAPTPIEERLLDLGVDNTVPADVSALIMACLAKKPEQRPQSAQAMAEWIALDFVKRRKGLEESLFATPTPDALGSCVEASASAKAVTSRRGRRVLWLGVASTVGLGLCFAGWLVYQTRVKPERRSLNPVPGPAQQADSPAVPIPQRTISTSAPGSTVELLPRFLWVRQVTGDGEKEGSHIAIRGASVYVTGWFKKNVQFGTIRLAGSGNQQTMFVAKYDQNGSPLWAKRAGGTGPVVGHKVAATGSGEGYATGWFVGTADFAGHQLATSAKHAGFLAKYDSAGSLVWVEKIEEAADRTANQTSPAYALALDSAGNAYVAGAFSLERSAPLSLGASPAMCLFVRKYTPEGKLAWQSSFPKADFGMVWALSVDEAANCYAAGYFSASVRFGSDTLVSDGGTDAFVAKLGSTGNLIWARKGGGQGGDYAADIVHDEAGNTYVTGWYSGSASFGSHTLSHWAGKPDHFIAKYDPSGEVVWAKRIQLWGEASLNGRGSIARDGKGDLYVSGCSKGATVFGGSALPNAGNEDAFLAHCDPQGNVLWASHVGGSGNDRATGLALDQDGCVYVTGQFQDSAAFGPSRWTATGPSDVFVAKLEPRVGASAALTSLAEPVVIRGVAQCAHCNLHESPTCQYAIKVVGPETETPSYSVIMNDAALRFTRGKDWCSKSELVLATGGVAQVNGRKVIYPFRIEQSQ